MENLNGVQAIIDLAKENERLKTDISDILLYIVAVKNGNQEVLARKPSDENVNFIFEQIAILAKGKQNTNNEPILMVKPSLPIDEIRATLSDLFMHDGNSSGSEREAGWNNCIYEISEWINNYELSQK